MESGVASMWQLYVSPADQARVLSILAHHRIVDQHNFCGTDAFAAIMPRLRQSGVDGSKTLVKVADQGRIDGGYRGRSDDEIGFNLFRAG